MCFVTVVYNAQYLLYETMEWPSMIYLHVRMGHNALGKFLKQILKEGGVDTVNESRMYKSNVFSKAYYVAFHTFFNYCL